MKWILFLLLTINNFLLAEDFSIIETTFKNADNLFDNNLNTYATSEDLKISEQVIIINLKQRVYIKDIEIVWGQDGTSDSYKILGSIDYLNWFVIKGDINASQFPQEGKNFINHIVADQKVVQFIKVYIPQEKNKNNILKIAEIRYTALEKIVPRILQYKINQIMENEAEISWQTDYETLGQIRFGLKVEQVDKIYTEFFYTKEHTLKLKDLLKGKKYYFQIINQTPYNQYFTSPLETFTTKGIPWPEVEEVKINKNSYNSTELYIQSNIESKVTILYGKAIDKLEKQVEDKQFKKVHLVKINDLKPLSKYYVKIMISDKGNNQFEYTYEFETDEYNIALNKNSEGTFNNTFIADVFQLEGNVLKRVNDGSFDYRGGMAVSFSPMKSDQYVIIDLGEKKAIEKIITYWRALAYPYFYYLYFSDDKTNWKKYDNAIGLKNKQISFIKGSGIPLIIGETDLKNVSTRYVKLLVPKGSPFYKKYALYDFLQLMELKIYGQYNIGY